MYDSCFNKDYTFNMTDIPLICGRYRYKGYIKNVLWTADFFSVRKLLRKKY